MRKTVLLTFLVLLVPVSLTFAGDLRSERVATAEEYLRGIYGGDPSVVDRLTSEDIVVSYPIIQSVEGAPTLHGRDAVWALAERFSKKWSDPRLKIHETVFEGNRLVLLWSFRARSRDKTSPGQPSSDSEYSWGGITLIRFDDQGKVSAEIGEESSPGPMARVGGEQR